MEHVLIVTDVFPPALGVGGRRPAKFAKYLPEYGYSPIVLTRAESNGLGVDLGSVSEPSRQSCRVVRTASPVADVYVRALRWLHLDDLAWFTLGRHWRVTPWLPTAKREALRLCKQYGIRLVYTTAPPFPIFEIGFYLKRRLGIPWIMDYRDPWTTGYARVYPSRLRFRIECRRESRMLRDTDAAVVVTPTMAELLVERWPQLSSKVHVIPNGYDRDDYPRCAGSNGFAGLHIGYAGTLTPCDYVERNPYCLPWRWLFSRFLYSPINDDPTTHSPLYLLRALHMLFSRRPELRQFIRVTFIGKVHGANQELVERFGFGEQVKFLSPRPHKEVVEILADADLLFLPMRSPKNGARCYDYSGKVFDYLALGKPILALIPEGDLADLIRRANVGWSVNPYDVDRIAALLSELADRKSRGLLHLQPDTAYIETFDYRVLTRQLAKLCDDLMGRIHLTMPGSTRCGVAGVARKK